MSDITKVDKNFVVKTKIDKDNIKFYDISEKPFKIYGVFKENGKYRRMPENIAKTMSEGVRILHTNTAGGRVRFISDSKYVAIHAVMSKLGKMPHFTFTGSIGFDLYVEDRYIDTFVPPFNVQDGFESVIEFDSKEKREITINFPLYSGVSDLYIGLEETAGLEEAKPYKNTKPIVYYGSSITQGGCASRPGMSYQSIVSRRFGYDYINLGFSGSACAEDEMIEFIKGLDMSVFVLDYDHNASTTEHLKNTHEKMFKAIREKQPNLPVIMMPRPTFYLTDEEKVRLNVIKNTYNNAVTSGDKNVYFIDNIALTKLCGNEGTVDGCHPTDFGFASMAEAVCVVLKNIKVI